MEKYELKERIGEGGMAEVFRAEVMGTGGFCRSVVIKRMRAELSSDEHLTELFANEARILSRLRHPNIVSVFDFSKDDEGHLFLAMELVDGVDLAGLMDGGLLPFEAVLYIGCEILRGLAYIHEARDGDGRRLGIVHRDVSPRNVLMAWDGSVKLADFGIATTSGHVGGSALTGTPGYVSPEQLQGLDVDGQADLFSVGVILYRLLTGQAPFTGHSVGECAAAVLVDDVPRPRELRAEIPDELDVITMRLLDRDRDRRYFSAQEVIDALLACEHASPRARDHLAEILRQRFLAPDQQAADREVRRKRGNVDALIREQLAPAGDRRPVRRTEHCELFEETPPKERQGRWIAVLSCAAIIVAVLAMWMTHNGSRPSQLAECEPHSAVPETSSDDVHAEHLAPMPQPRIDQKQEKHVVNVPSPPNVRTRRRVRATPVVQGMADNHQAPATKAIARPWQESADEPAPRSRPWRESKDECASQGATTNPSCLVAW